MQFQDKIQLPSHFKPYAFKELYVRGLNYSEVLSLYPIVAGVSGIPLFEMISNCMSPIPAGDLTVGDFWFIAAWIRVNTFKTSPITISWSCPECKFNNSIDCYIEGSNNPNVKSIDIIELDEEYSEPAVIELPSGLSVPLRYPRIKDEFIAKQWLNQTKGDGKWVTIDTVFPRMALQIANDQPLAENINLINSLSVEDLEVIRQFELVYQHGLSNHISDKCRGEQCEYSTNRIRFSFRESDILPLVSYSEYIKANITFKHEGSSVAHIRDNSIPSNFDIDGLTPGSIERSR